MNKMCCLRNNTWFNLVISEINLVKIEYLSISFHRLCTQVGLLGAKVVIYVQKLVRGNA